MRNSYRSLAILGAFAAMAIACAKVPYTGRVQYNLIPDSLMRGLGKSTYKAMLGDVKVKKKGEDSQTLNKVGRRLSRVADQPKYDWEFSLIKEDEMNAWALPGGYIGFYTGILPVLKNEAGMAFVMGHEVGHATAHHGAERLTQQLTLVGGLLGLELWLKDHSKLDRDQRRLVLGALGVGGTLGVVLPFSRMHEAEADVVGMMYMAKAGYPPNESIQVWERMSKKSGGGLGLPAFLSTHPSHKKRISNQKDWLPKASKRYQRNALKYDTKKALWGKGARKDGPDGGRAGSGNTGRDGGNAGDRGGKEQPPAGTGGKRGGGGKGGGGETVGGKRFDRMGLSFSP